ncbi:MAG: hypothetical protein R3E64_11035 [Halioglobus sp.]
MTHAPYTLCAEASISGSRISISDALVPLTGSSRTANVRGANKVIVNKFNKVLDIRDKSREYYAKVQLKRVVNA